MIFGSPRLLIHRDVVARSQSGVVQYPTVEEGGKLVGVLVLPDQPPPPELQRWLAEESVQQLQGGRGAVLVLGSISSGPRAIRTPTHLMPDAAFQVHVFQQLEMRHPEIQHIGTWHSHHPNGLRRFSSGDTEGYVETIRSRDHLPSLFVAGLATDRRALADGFFLVYRRSNPTKPFRVGRNFEVLQTRLSLQSEIDQIEAQLLLHSPTTPHSAAGILDEQLRAHFNVVSGPLQEAEAISWVFDDGDSSTRIVLTQPRVDQGHAAVSMSVVGRRSTLTLDSSLSSDPRQIILWVKHALHQLRNLNLEGI